MVWCPSLAQKDALLRFVGCLASHSGRSTIVTAMAHTGNEAFERKGHWKSAASAKRYIRGQRSLAYDDVSSVAKSLRSAKPTADARILSEEWAEKRKHAVLFNEDVHFGSVTHL